MNRLSAWCRNWGARDEEVRGTMLGDRQVALPSCQTTLGVTINAAPAAIWPWLMQLGIKRRAEALDRNERRAA